MKRRNLTFLIFILVPVILVFILYQEYKTRESIIDYISQQTIVKEIETEKTITIFVERTEMDYMHYSTVQLNIENILQNPELPTGCEVTSLAIILNYLGYDVDKVYLSDNFLPKGEIGETHPDVAFIGNPKDSNSFGANAPVLEKTANDYLDYMQSNYNAYNVSSSDFTELLKYINDGYPVMIWGTMYMQEGYYSIQWTIDNEVIKWYSKFHCMVLIGYTEDSYIIADPLQGIVEYDKNIVEQRYNELEKQALVIY